MKSQYTKQLIFILLFTLTQNRISAQCDNPITPAYSCEDAAADFFNNGPSFLCGETEFCVDASNAPHLNPPIPFCTGGSVFNNPMWFGFIGDQTGIIDLEVMADECNGGIQWALYDQCGAYFSAIACQSNPVLPPNQPFNIYATVVPGIKYYLALDGANGATCIYRFKVNSGIGEALVLPSVDSLVNGPLTICPEETYSYSITGFEYATIYNWYLDGVNIGSSDSATSDVTMPSGLSEGIHDLCVIGTNPCDPVGQQLCWQIEIIRNKTLDINHKVCAGDSIFFQNNYYQPGNYQLPYEGENGCISGINLTVSVNYIPSDTLYNINICADQDSIEMNGTYYLTDSLYTGSISTEVGCIYEAKFNISRIENNGIRILSDIDTLPCDNSSIAILSFEGQITGANEKLYETYSWENANGDILGIQPTLSVSGPGTYYLNITSAFENPADILGVPQELICDNLLQYTIYPEDFIYTNPIVINIDANINDYDFFLEIDNFENFPEGTEFNWLLPDNVNLVEIEDQYIHFFTVHPGTYDICLYAQGPCNASDTICTQVKFNSISTDEVNLRDALKLRNNPISNELIFDIDNLYKKELYIEILNNQGQVVENKKATSAQEIRINVNKLTSGIYYYKIVSADKNYKTGKFIKI